MAQGKDQQAVSQELSFKHQVHGIISKADNEPSLVATDFDGGLTPYYLSWLEGSWYVLCH